MWCVMSVVLAAAAPEVVALSTLKNEESMAETVWTRAPDLQSVRTDVARAIADERKTYRLPNPSLDVGLNTLPIGPSNPANLKDPWLNTPNVSVGLSVLLEIGKRGPRQDAAAEASRAASLRALEALRIKVLELQDVMGDIAGAQVRVDFLTALVEDATHLVQIQKARADKGDTSALDADRAQLDLESTLTLLGEAKEERVAQLRACAALLGSECKPFIDVNEANEFLDRAAVVHRDALSSRPDLQALEATERSARATQRLAQNQWIPDPTVHVGYVRDQFVISGNQLNSLFIGVSLPLPIFEHGVDDANAAGVAAQSAQRERERLLESAQSQLNQLDGQLDRVTKRLERLRTQSLPLAMSVVERLDAAVTRGAAPIQELLLARRALVELSVTATELDLNLFHLHVARARVGTSLSKLPESP